MTKHVPTLKSLFVTALRATAREDLNRNSNTVWELQLERATFDERTVANFVILASMYYTKAEIGEFIEEELSD